MNDIFVYSDSKSVAFEMLAKAAELCEKLASKACAIIAQKDVDENTIAEYCQQGADACYVVKHNHLDVFQVEPYTTVLAELVKKYQPFALFIGGTKRGRELAPRVATRLSAGCIADCIDVRLDEKLQLVVDRRTLSGAAVATEKFNSKPQILTIQPKAFEPLAKKIDRKVVQVEEQISIDEPKVKLVSKHEKSVGGLKIEDAQIIVSFGRGLKQKSDIKIISALAEILNGVLGCSRPIAADLKWLSEDHWVGLSGHKVKPKLYIACGISGQIQHLAGMRDSHIIVAINKDENAPIFKYADYGIVGDLYKIVPRLTELLSKK